MPVEHRDRRAARVGWRLQHQRRHSGDQHGLGHTLRAVAGNIAGDFAAAGGVADVDGVPQVEAENKLVKVVGVRVHVLAVEGLARSAEAAAVMRDAAKAVGSEKEHLVFKGIRGERPAVAEDHGLSSAPILVVNLRAVFGRDRVARVGKGRSARLLGRCSPRHCPQARGSGNATAADQARGSGNNATAADQEFAARCQCVARHFFVSHHFQVSFVSLFLSSHTVFQLAY